MKQRRRRRGEPAVNPRSARTMLKTLREFSPDFGSVKLTQGALTIEVTFDKTPKPTESPKKKPPTEKGQRPAIEMLNEKPPAFEFEGVN